MCENNPPKREEHPRAPQRRRAFARSSAKRFVAPILALALAFGTCVAAHGSYLADGGQARSTSSTGGSIIGILLDGTHPAGGDPDLITNDSYLGVLLTTAASEDVTVTFLLERPAEGENDRVYHTEVVGMGISVPQPPDPVWPKQAGDTDDFVFDVWCDEAGASYDFAAPVTADTRLYATWIKKTPEQKEVSVTFKGCGGTMPDPNDATQMVEECTAVRSAGAHYPFPADPTRTGYTFQGWFTAETGGTRVTTADTLGEGDTTLYAQWTANTYRVCYHENHGTSPLSYTEPRVVTYDATDVAFADWNQVHTQGGFSKPDGKDLDGWCATKDGTGEKYKIGDAIVNLTDVDGKVVDVYALWEKDGTVEDGPFDVTFNFNDGTGRTHVVEDVEKFATVPEEDPVKAPKHAGYQFAGWYSDEELTEPWAFDDQITADTELWAKWDLRLDVTMPVSVKFAVDATSGTVTAPEMGAYAVKSRTVREVTVDAAELVSEQGELETFFSLLGEDADWADALQAMTLSVQSEHASTPTGIAFAADAPEGTTWRNTRTFDEEKEAYTLDAFSYAGTAFDELWQGADPSKRLGMQFGLTIPADKLIVNTNLDGPQPITHVRFTVSVQG